MIQRRTQERHFRHSPRGREPLSAPGQGGEHVHYSPSTKVGLGCITSRKPTGAPTFFELLAYELGCTVTAAKQAYEEGLV